MRPDQTITSSMIVALLAELRVRFGAEYTLVLEPTTPGGIRMTNWPERPLLADADTYKSFRFCFRAYGEWPRINADTEQLWTQLAVPHAIWTPKDHRPMRGHCRLKTTFGAPAWTRGELQHFLTALQAVRIPHLKSTLPTLRAMAGL